MDERSSKFKRLLTRSLQGVMSAVFTSQEKGWSNTHPSMSPQSNASIRFSNLRNNCTKVLHVINEKRQEQEQRQGQLEAGLVG